MPGISPGFALSLQNESRLVFIERTVIIKRVISQKQKQIKKYSTSHTPPSEIHTPQKDAHHKYVAPGENVEHQRQTYTTSQTQPHKHTSPQKSTSQNTPLTKCTNSYKCHKNMSPHKQPTKLKEMVYMGNY